MRGRVAIIFSPALLGCTVLTDVDSLRSIDASIDASTDTALADTAMMDSPSMETGTDGSAMKVFVDDFNRPDNALIGNGWLMKTAGSHDIQGNLARVRTSGKDYHDNVVYRPTNEDVRDVTISVELTVSALPPGYPQIMSRIVQSTVLTPLAFDGYIFFLPNQPDQAVLGRQRGAPYLTQLRTISLNPPVDTTHTYRLTLTATGANPVSLSAKVEVKMGTTWSPIGADTYLDTDPARFDAAGAVGFGSSGDEALGLYSYDNFTRTSL